MNVNRHARSSLVLLILAASLTACAHSYTPTLSLDESPVTIQASVKMEPLKDETPPEDKESGLVGDQGFYSTSDKELQGGLATLVGRAILADFREHQVFATIRKHPPQSDLILSGTIHRFYERRQRSWLLFVPGVGLIVAALGAPIEARDGGVDIELHLVKSDGKPVGTYRGQSNFFEEVTLYNERTWGTPMGVLLNRAFTEAVRQIREKLLEDRAAILGSVGER